MCINVEELNKNVVTIKNYKSIKKKADEKLKPLEQTVKDFMDETGQTVDTEGIDTSVLFKTTVVRPLRIS